MSGSAVPNPSTALARVVIDELTRNGVRHLVCAPGSRSAALVIAAWEHPHLAVHVEIDERSAGFFALGVAKATGVPAAVVTTSGTAVANLYPAVVEADTSFTPLMVISADRPPELRHAGANQTIDQVKMFGERVRWFVDVPPAVDEPWENPYWRSTVCRAVAEAIGRSAPPGPVHLNLGFREPLVPLSDDGRTSAPPYRASIAGRPDGRPWTAGGDRTVPGGGHPIGGEARRPLVVVGDGGCRGLEDLIGRVPVVAEGHSGWRRPGTITTAHHLLGHQGFVRRHLPDLVVTVGRVGLSPHVSALVARTERHLAVSPWGWPDPARTAWGLTHDLVESLRPEPGWTEAWARAESVAREALDGFLDGMSRPVEPRVVRDAVRVVEGRATLVVGSSMPIRDLDWFGPAGDVEVIANRGASGIDGLVSTALGAAAGGRRIVALLGDLALLHDSSGLLVDPRPSAVLVVLNNDGGGIFSFLPQARFPGYVDRLFATPRGRNLADLARLYDLAHVRIERASELEDAVIGGLNREGTTLVEVPGDRSENLEVHRAATRAVHRRLDTLLSRER